MSASLNDKSLAQDYQSDGELLLAQVRSLTDELVNAWRERAVFLSASESEQLQAEIRRTCELLAALVQTR